MTQTISLTQSDYRKLIDRIADLEETVKLLTRKVLKKEPILLSEDAERQVGESLQAFEKGKYVRVKNKEELQHHLDELKRT